MGGKLMFVIGKLEFLLNYVWVEGEFRFNRGWKNFVKSANICIGDMLVIQPIEGESKYPVCIISAEHHHISKRFAGMFSFV